MRLGSWVGDPTIIGFSPAAARPGQVVTITGTGFGDITVMLGRDPLPLLGGHAATSVASLQILP